MAYRDFDDGYKMPAGARKPVGSSMNSRPAASNGGKSNGSQKSVASGKYPRPVSANGYETGGYKRPAGSNGYKRPSGSKANGSKSGGSRRSLFKALIAVLCVLVAGVIAIGVYFVFRWKNDDYTSLQTDNLVVLEPGSEESEQPVSNLDTVAVSAGPAATTSDDTAYIEYNGQKYMKNKNVVNLLFLGIDTNAERKKIMMGYRSDMLMVCAVDTAAKKATLISIPRDTYTTMYKIDETTGEIGETVQDKINAAYSYGGGAKKYSYANAMTCVQMFLDRTCELNEPLDFELDIPVYLYAGIDMDGIPQVASAVGGVEVTLTDSIPNVGKKGQTVTLKHQNAVEYLTNRHDTNGDVHRAERQQQFMISLAKKIKSMGPVDMILSLYDELQKYVWTNLNTDQMIDFAKILTKVNIDSIDMYMIQGEGKTVKGSYCMVHDEAATLQLLLDVYYTKVS